MLSRFFLGGSITQSECVCGGLDRRLASCNRLLPSAAVVVVPSVSAQKWGTSCGGLRSRMGPDAGEGRSPSSGSDRPPCWQRRRRSRPSSDAPPRLLRSPEPELPSLRRSTCWRGSCRSRPKWAAAADAVSGWRWPTQQ